MALIISNTVLAATLSKIGNEWFSVAMAILVALSDFLPLAISPRHEAPSASSRHERMQPSLVPQQPQRASFVKIENDRDVRDDVVTIFPQRDMGWNALLSHPLLDSAFFLCDSFSG